MKHTYIQKETDSKKKRYWGIDILRILSMCGIIALHLLNQGGIVNEARNAGGYKRLVVEFILAFVYCSVNLFAIISGFLYEGVKSISYKVLVKLWSIAAFYILTVTGYVYIDKPEIFSNASDIVKFLIPPIAGRYWYLVCYSALYLLIPYINQMIENLNKSELKKLLFILVILFSVVPFIGMTDFFHMNMGYSPWWLIVCFLIGCYIKKYNIDVSILKSTGAIAFNIMVSVLISYTITAHIGGFLSNTFSLYSKDLPYLYTSPLTVSTSIMVFCLFLKIRDIPSRAKSILLSASSSAFGVYLLHCETLIFDYYIKDAFTWVVTYRSYYIPFIIIVVIQLVYCLCWIVDIIRRLVLRKLL